MLKPDWEPVRMLLLSCACCMCMIEPVASTMLLTCRINFCSQPGEFVVWTCTGELPLMGHVVIFSRASCSWAKLSTACVLVCICAVLACICCTA